MRLTCQYFHTARLTSDLPPQQALASDEIISRLSPTRISRTILDGHRDCPARGNGGPDTLAPFAAAGFFILCLQSFSRRGNVLSGSRIWPGGGPRIGESQVPLERPNAAERERLEVASGSWKAVQCGGIRGNVDGLSAAAVCRGSSRRLEVALAKRRTGPWRAAAAAATF